MFVLKIVTDFASAHSAENIAKYFFNEIGILINDENVKVKEVLIWETPRSAVTYSE